MVFYYHMIYSPETDNQDKMLFTTTIIKLSDELLCTILHTLCMMRS
jgi:hypothetical protein